jgi:hypothetical protein
LWYLYLLFALLAVICGLVAIGLLVKSRHILRLSGSAQVLTLVVSAVCLNGFFILEIDSYRFRRSIEGQALEWLRHIRVGLDKYVESTGHLPPADSWCNALRGMGTSDVFRLPQLRDQTSCNFAFNKNFGNQPLSELPGNGVLIIEADGPWNNCGGSELLNGTRCKFKAFVVGWPKTIYILFVDRTIVKYRLRDGAIAKYTGPYDEFGISAYQKAFESFDPFLRKGKTPYSPLRWK